MLTLTDTTLTLQASAAKLVQMQLMPVSNPVDSCNQVVCVITTYGKDAPESRIAAYSVRWRKIDVASHLALPQQPYVASFAPLPQMAVNSYGDYIKTQVLADDITIAPNDGTEVEFDEFKLNINITKA